MQDGETRRHDDKSLFVDTLSLSMRFRSFVVVVGYCLGWFCFSVPVFASTRSVVVEGKTITADRSIRSVRGAVARMRFGWAG